MLDADLRLDAALTPAAGEVVAILGSNGAGKPVTGL
jgi:ABC-type hemin transport system ATPase subunit